MLVALVVLLINIGELPRVLSQIVHGAFGADQALFGTAFAVEVCDEYEDDLHRWTVALATARDDVEQG